MLSKVTLDVPSEIIYPTVIKDISYGFYFCDLTVHTCQNLNAAEFYLDSNCLKALISQPYLAGRWSKSCGVTSGFINPSIALLEHQISNKNNFKNKCLEVQQKLSPYGLFNTTFGDDIFQTFDLEEKNNGSLIGSFFPYMCYLYDIYHTEATLTDAVENWSKLFRQDVPRFTLLWMFGVFCIYLKFNQSAKNKFNHKKIYDYVNSIFSLRDKEKSDFCCWLKNKTFDLLGLYFADKMQKNSVYRKAIYVTSDVVMAEFYFMYFSYHDVEAKENGRSLFHFNHWLLETIHRDLFLNILLENHPKSRVAPTTDTIVDTINQRTINLYDYIMPRLHSDRRSALLKIIDEYGIFVRT